MKMILFVVVLMFSGLLYGRDVIKVNRSNPRLKQLGVRTVVSRPTRKAFYQADVTSGGSRLLRYETIQVADRQRIKALRSGLEQRRSGKQSRLIGLKD